MLIKSVTGQILITTNVARGPTGDLIEKCKNSGTLSKGNPRRPGSKSQINNLKTSRVFTRSQRDDRILEKASPSASKMTKENKEVKSDSKEVVSTLNKKKFKTRLNLKTKAVPKGQILGSGDSRYIRSNKKVLSTEFSKTRVKEDLRLTALIYNLLLGTTLLDFYLVFT